MDNWKKYAIALALLVAAFSIGRFSAPAKVETKQITCDSEVKDRDQNIKEVTRETKRPDGTTVKTTIREKETITKTARQSESVTSKTVEVRPSFRVGVLYEPAIKSFQKESGSVILEKRIVSELYIGVSASSNRTVGVVLSLGF